MEINGLGALQNLNPTKSISGTSATSGGEDFKTALFNAIEKVNQTEKDSETAVNDIVSGKSDNIQDMMIATTKAEVELSFANQVNSRAIEAYKEVMRLQL